MLRTTTSRSRLTSRQPGPPAFICEAERINPVLRVILWAIERQSGEPFVGGRLLAWHTPTAMSMLAAGAATWIFPGRVRRRLGTRMVNLVALAAAYTEGSPYCAADFAAELDSLAPSEVHALRAGADVSTVPSFSARERLAIRYARLISATPLEFPPDFVAELTSAFTEAEIVVLAATAADVNYNGRMFEALGAPAPNMDLATSR